MKAGVKSSEFWLSLLGVILVFLNDKLSLSIPVESIIGVLTMIVGYIASRTYLKAKKD